MNLNTLPEFYNLYIQEQLILNNAYDGRVVLDKNKNLYNGYLKLTNNKIVSCLKIVDGLPQDLAIYKTDSSISKVYYLNGLKHGEEIFSMKNHPYRLEQHYAHGILHGDVCEKTINWVKNFTYVNGIKQGKVFIKFKDGSSEEASYVNGQLEGDLKINFPNKQVLLVKIHQNKLNGPAVRLDENGRTIMKFNYLNGSKNGPAESYFPDGTTIYFTYVNNIAQGHARRIDSYGNQYELVYENGKTISDQCMNTQQDELSKIANEVSAAHHGDHGGIFDDFTKQYFQD